MSRLPATPTNENAIPEVECDAAGYREHRRKVADKWTNVELLILSFVLFLPYHFSDFRIKIFQEKKFDKKNAEGESFILTGTMKRIKRL